MRAAFAYLREREWDKLQSLWVLPTARRLYLIGALAAVLVTALALAAALVFQLLTVGATPRLDVPDPASVEVKAIDPASLDALFKGPQTISIEVIPVVRPVVEGTPIARFSAETPWGMAAGDGFQLVGGREMSWYSEAPDPDRDGLTVLVVTKMLAEGLNALPADAVGSKQTEVRVLAKDAHGNVAQPVTLNFRVLFKQPDQPASSEPAAETVEDKSGPKELQRVLIALGLLAGPAGSPEYFAARETARNEPARCDADGDAKFNAAYVAAYDRVHKSLTQSNVDTFYSGLCEAWTQRLTEARQEAERLDKLRVEVMARNAAAEVASEARKSGARALRDVAIGFAITAVGFFMIVALFLAFLAIEGHSNALRQALETLARERERSDA